MEELIKHFLSPHDEDLYPPCGMFTLAHYISMSIIIVLIVIGLYFTIKSKNFDVKKTCRIFAIIVTTLELCKISFSLFINKSDKLNAWLPLAYCSIFIYTLYLAGFGKGKIEKTGYAFLTGGGLIAGAAFLLFPTTSLTLYPVYHFQSIYSMLFHGAMVYIALTILIKQVYIMVPKDTIYYIVYISVYTVPAIILNIIFDCNFMFYDNPYRMPIQLVVDIYNYSNVLYTIFIYFAFSTMYMITYGGYYLITRFLIKPKNISLEQATIC